MPQTTPFAKWLVEANAALLRSFAIVFIKDDAAPNWIGDSGADESDMRRLYDSGDTPQEVATWWGEKYGLDALDWSSRDMFEQLATDYLRRVEAPAHA